MNLIETLKEHIVIFTFEKSDGTIREIRGTLCEKYFPTTTLSETIKDVQSEKKEGLYSVYDLKNKGWRSFYLDKVKEIKGICV